jgi:hypothetical protein
MEEKVRLQSDGNLHAALRKEVRNDCWDKNRARADKVERAVRTVILQMLLLFVL